MLIRTRDKRGRRSALFLAAGALLGLLFCSGCGLDAARIPHFFFR